ncbi:four helix bundle protein [Nonlabens antarcticus]|uniref:four helix bundle protein n=1 Tax=Nonlabens antarcticus TaxID=392714 RepID=UPI00189109F3|nr:four helix bundle protein [Nonlabens antarcticus]
MSDKPYDVEERLIEFAAQVTIEFNFPLKNYASKYYAEQLIRSSGSAALNYGEFAGASSAKDRANKLRIAFKEMKECHNNIRIQHRANLLKEKQADLIDESLQLCKILSTIIKNLK